MDDIGKIAYSDTASQRAMPSSLKSIYAFLQDALYLDYGMSDAQLTISYDHSKDHHHTLSLSCETITDLNFLNDLEAAVDDLRSNPGKDILYEEVDFNDAGDMLYFSRIEDLVTILTRLAAMKNFIWDGRVVPVIGDKGRNYRHTLEDLKSMAIKDDQPNVSVCTKSIYNLNARPNHTKSYKPDPVRQVAPDADTQAIHKIVSCFLEEALDASYAIDEPIVTIENEPHTGHLILDIDDATQDDDTSVHLNTFFAHLSASASALERQSCLDRGAINIYERQRTIVARSLDDLVTLLFQVSSDYALGWEAAPTAFSPLSDVVMDENRREQAETIIRENPGLIDCLSLKDAFPSRDEMLKEAMLYHAMIIDPTSLQRPQHTLGQLRQAVEAYNAQSGMNKSGYDPMQPTCYMQ